jgi:hypothetical protein
MKKEKQKKSGPITIYKIARFHNCPMMVQKVGYSIFQWIFLWKGNFYQGWIRIKPKWNKWFKKDPYTPDQKVKIINWCFDGAATTIETLEKDEKYKKEKK